MEYIQKAFSYFNSLNFLPSVEFVHTYIHDPFFGFGSCLLHPGLGFLGGGHHSLLSHGESLLQRIHTGARIWALCPLTGSGSRLITVEWSCVCSDCQCGKCVCQSVCAAPLRVGWALSAQTDWDTLYKKSSQAD